MTLIGVDILRFIGHIINKKNIKLAIMLLFIMLFIFLLPGIIIDGVPKVTPVTAQNGYIDFNDFQNKQSIKNQKEIYRLEGTWEYYPNQLLVSSDFKGKNIQPVRYVEFPHYWSSDKQSFADASGCATYRLVCKKSEKSGNIGIYSRFQFGAYKVFINGAEVLQIGNVSENPQEYYMSYQSGNAYAGFDDSDTVELILHIQNYDHVLAGFTGDIYYGSMANVKFFTEFLMILNGVMIGFLVLLLCYFLAVYFQNRTKELYLNFALVTLMSIYVTMTTCNESITYSVVPFISPHVIFKLEYITQIIAALFSTQYIVKKYMKSKPYSYFTVALCIVIIMALIIVPSMTVSKMRLQFQITATSYYLVPLYLTLKACKTDKTKTALWEFISLVTLISGIIFTKLGIMLWNCVDLFPVMVALYCFIQIVVLLYYYSGVEEDLRSLNQTLESKIEERTKEFVELSKRAESANIAKSDFLAQMSHEIRTPMNAIIGLSDIINTDNFDETQKLYFRDIKKVSHSLLNIINDILDFSKIESGKFQIIPVHFNFYSMIDNICSLFYYSAKSKGLYFESNIDKNIPAVLYGDETRIRQAISNIISNAIKYTLKGFVKFSAERINNGSEILFTVTDTGIGIKKEDIPRLFRLFEQLDKNHSVKGTGLGLAICKQLADLMGGYVTVKSEYGAGSTFTICLPLAEGNPALVEPDYVMEQIYAESAKVLVVDDNSINITVAKGILATHHIIPDSAEGGRKAVDMVKENEYDIVFMDHMMPDMDGIEATTAIRALGGSYETLPIIALTANAISGTKEFLIENGMSDFISKPIDRQELNNILAKWLPVDKLVIINEPGTAMSSRPQPGFLTALSQIPHLNAEYGLANVGGNVNTFKNVLSQMIYEMPAYMEELLNNMREKSFERYAVTVHGIKGSLNSIGAESLGDWAFMLEKSAKANDTEICIAQTEEFVEAVLSFIETLVPLLKKSEIVIEDNKQEASFEQLGEMLTHLETACMLGDCTTIDNISEDLKHFSFGIQYDDKISEIITLTWNMMYDKAVEKIGQILGR